MNCGEKALKKWIVFIMLVIPAFIYPEETLIDAVTNGDVAFIKNYEGDIDQPLDSDNNTALIYAISFSKTNVIKTLIQKKANVNATNRIGDNALMIAVFKENTDLVKALIKAGADLNAENEDGKSALSTACEKRNITLINLLRKSGAENKYYFFNSFILTGDFVRVRSEPGTNSSVFTMLNKGAKVKMIVRTNIPLSVGDGSAGSPIKTGFWALVEFEMKGKPMVGYIFDAYLKEESATKKIEGNIDVMDKNGWTALMLNAAWGEIDKVKTLIESGADVNIKNKDGWTALMFAINNGQTDQEEEIVKDLIEAKANVNLVNKNGMTALMFAARQGNTNVIQDLIEAKSDINIVDSDGMTALMFAAAWDRANMVKTLIEAGADVSGMNNKGETALSMAKDASVIDLLKAAGAK